MTSFFNLISIYQNLKTLVTHSFSTSILLCLLNISPVQADPFDPAICEIEDNDKIIVRLPSGLAFALEPQFYNLDDPVFVKLNPSPNILTDSYLGCPNNPLNVNRFGFDFDYPADPNRDGDDLIDPVELLRIGGFQSSSEALPYDSTVFDAFKSAFEFCSEYPSGLLACHACYEDRDRLGFCEDSDRPGQNFGQPGWQAGSRWIAKPHAYDEFSGQTFSVSCVKPMSLGEPFASQQCNVEYLMFDGLSVSYRFDAYKLHPSNIFDFDRALRTEILAKRVPQFDGPSRRKQD